MKLTVLNSPSRWTNCLQIMPFCLDTFNAVALPLLVTFLLHCSGKVAASRYVRLLTHSSHLLLNVSLFCGKSKMQCGSMSAHYGVNALTRLWNVVCGEKLQCNLC